MAKTGFSDGNQQTGVPGTVVGAAWLNKVFAPVFDGLDADGHVAAFQKGADIASAAALVFNTANGNRFHVTGNANPTSMPNLGGGTHVILSFSNALVIPHDAVNGVIVCPGGRNLTVVPNEKYLFIEYAPGKWELVASSSAADGVITSLNSGPLGGIRNAFINGAMMIALRGAVTPVMDVDTYVIDRFYVRSSGAALTSAVQTTAAAGLPPGFQYCLTLTGKAAVTACEIAQRIKAANIIPLSGGSVTFSCYIYNNTGAAFTPTLSWLTPTSTADTFSAVTSRSGPTPLQACPDATMTRVSATLDISALANIKLGLEVALNIPSGVMVAGKVVHTTGWQLEVGPVPTTFENRDDRLRCAEYYQQIYNAYGNAVNGTMVQISFSHIVPMRIAPTWYGQSGVLSIEGGGGGILAQSAPSISFLHSSACGGDFYLNNFTGLAACYPYILSMFTNCIFAETEL